MKKIGLTTFACTLMCVQVFSQLAKPKLGVGDRMPNVPLRSLVNFDKVQSSMSQFAGRHVILDFWATWCGKCLQAFPKIDSFQKKYKDYIQFLGVTTGDSSTHTKYLSNIEKFKGIKIASVVEDSTISNLFEYDYIPHYVWIDDKGVIKAITGSDEVTDENISKFIKNDPFNFQLKVDKRRFGTLDRPFFFKKQYDYGAYPETHLYNSLITSYNPELESGASRGINFLNIPNQPIKSLYQFAFGMFDLSYLNDNRLVLEGFDTYMDSLRIGVFNPDIYRGKWKEMIPYHSYSYELAFADSVVNSPYMFEMMQNDINRYFAIKGIQGKKEKRKVKVLALTLISTSEKIKSKGGNSAVSDNDYSFKMVNLPIGYLIGRLEAFYYKWGNLPIKDYTGFKGPVDIELNTDLSDINLLKNALLAYGLKLEEREENIDMVVISKKANPALSTNNDPRFRVK